MSDRKSLKKQLQRARRIRDILREQKAGYSLRVPPDLELALQEKEDEVTNLENKLSEISNTAALSEEQEPLTPLVRRSRLARLLLLGIGAAIFVVLMGVGLELWQRPAEPPEPFLTYEETGEFSFTIAYPPDWDVQEVGDRLSGEMVRLISPLEDEADRFRERVVVYVEDYSARPLSLREYTDIAKKEIERSFDLIRLEEATLANRAGMAATFSGVEEGVEVTKRQVWMLLGYRTYLVTYEAESSKFEQFEEEAQRAIASFTVGEE